MVLSEDRKISVLHVDDDVDLAEVAASFLEREDDRFTVEPISNVDDGLEYLAEHDVDCVVSDYEMPGLNGIEFLEAIRETDPELPFILFTGKGSEQIASRAISAGVTDYLQKETNTDQYTVLANRIKNAVAAYRTTRELERFETIVQASGDAVYTLDAEGRYTFVNETIEEITGYERCELIDENVSKMMDPADIERGTDLIRTLLTTSRDRGTYELTVTTADGDRIPCEVSIALLPFDDEFRGTVGVVRDISERKAREQELERANVLLSTLFDTLPAGVLAENTSRDILAANPKMDELFGLSRTTDSLVGTDCQQFARDTSEMFAEPKAFVERINEVVSEGEPVHNEELELADGRTFARSYRPIELTKGDGHLWVYRDITDRKRRERKLESAQRRFEAVFHNQHAFMAVLDLDGTVHEVNNTAVEFVENAPTEVIGTPFWETPWWRHSRELQDELQAWIAQAATGDLVRYEADHYAPDGEKLTVDGVLHPIKDNEGTVISVLAAGRDITERKQYEETIARLHEVATDLGECSTANEVYTRTITAAESLLDFDLAAIAIESDGLLEVEAMSQAMPLDEKPTMTVDEGIAGKTYRRGESYLIQDVEAVADAEPRADARAAMSLPVGDRGIFQVVEDIPRAFTERDMELAELLIRHTERALDRLDRERTLEQQNERLDEFASLISHDLQNPLNVAIGYLELLHEEYDDDRFDEISHAHTRMQTLIENLLTVARHGDTVTDMQEIDLRALAETCWRNVETAEATLQLETSCHLEADPSRLKQLLENLMRNAVTHGGDSITVTIGDLDGGFYVADDGAGIPEAECEQIFTSGYSSIVDGTGLGLRIVQEIVEAHDWEITVDESESGGARFEIKFQRASSATQS